MILIKALPHRSSQYFETVCCAGIGRDQRWRRQYPVPFRILADEQRFSRWQWVSYQFVKPENDKRIESQKVLSHTLNPASVMRAAERASFLAPLTRSSLKEADSRRESLTLVRPQSIELRASPKSAGEIANETAKHKALADQLSLFDNTAKPLTPCPMQFVLHWIDQDSKRHRHECDDWETSAAYNRFQRQYGEKQAIQILKEKYEQQYFDAGLALAFSTHSRRNIENGTDNQWLLVGLVRLDAPDQGQLSF